MHKFVPDARIAGKAKHIHQAPPIYGYELVKCNSLRITIPPESVDFKTVKVVEVPFEFVGHGDRLETGATLQVGPYRMRVIDRSYILAGYICVPDWTLARVCVWHYRAERLMVSIYYRLLATARVWGLADWNDCAVSSADAPSWRSVHVLGKLAKWMRI